jgi:inosose dehydratase
MFHVSCHLGLWGHRYPEGLRLAAQSGFRAIEIGSKFLLAYENRLGDWLRLTADSEVRVSAVFEFGHFDHWNRRREIYLHHDRLGRLLENAGISSVILGPGMKLHKVSSPQDRLNRIGMVSEIAKRYEAHGVSVGIHPHWGHCIFTRDEIDHVMEHVREEIGLVPDLGHTAEADIDILELLSSYLARVPCLHVKDFRRLAHTGTRRYDRKTRFCGLGEGESNIKELMQFLKDRAYDGWLTAEVEDGECSPEATIRYMSDYMITMQAMLEEEEHENCH